MSVDIIGWESLKRIDFRKRLDQMLARQESIESSIQQLNIGLEKMEDSFSKEMLIQSLDTMMDFMELQRLQIIWINALREGMMEIESHIL